jgi:DNA-binding NarL/FixJ family response regulator
MRYCASAIIADAALLLTTNRRIGRAMQSGYPYSRFLVRPYALVGSRWEVAVAAACVTLLGIVFLAEILTPDVAISTLGLGPLLAAMWVLSARWAVLVAASVASFVGLAMTLEAANRITLVVIVVTLLGAAIVTRMYANALAVALSRHRHQRPAAPGSTRPSTLGDFDGFSRGLKALTRRELEVAQLACDGYTATEIGHRLHISGRTVESHLASTYGRLGIMSRLELMRMAPASLHK